MKNLGKYKLNKQITVYLGGKGVVMCLKNKPIKTTLKVFNNYELSEYISPEETILRIKGNEIPIGKHIDLSKSKYFNYFESSF